MPEQKNAVAALALRARGDAAARATLRQVFDRHLGAIVRWGLYPDDAPLEMARSIRTTAGTLAGAGAAASPSLIDRVAQKVGETVLERLPHEEAIGGQALKETVVG
jgi:hypothetical protein